jgi:hypothetical protein
MIVAIPFGSWLNSSSPRHRDVADTDLHPAPRQARQRLATGAKLGHDLKIRFEVQKLGKAGADDKVIVDESDGGHGAFLAGG